MPPGVESGVRLQIRGQGDIGDFGGPRGNLYISINVEPHTLFKRKDDDLKVVMSRYDLYQKSTKPVLDFLSKKPNFHEIDGTGKIEEITSKIDVFLNV